MLRVVAGIGAFCVGFYLPQVLLKSANKDDTSEMDPPESSDSKIITRIVRTKVMKD